MISWPCNSRPDRVYLPVQGQSNCLFPKWAALHNLTGTLFFAIWIEVQCFEARRRHFNTLEVAMFKSLNPAMCSIYKVIKCFLLLSPPPPPSLSALPNKPLGTMESQLWADLCWCHGVSTELTSMSVHGKYSSMMYLSLHNRIPQR